MLTKLEGPFCYSFVRAFGSKILGITSLGAHLRGKYGKVASDAVFGPFKNGIVFIQSCVLLLTLLIQEKNNETVARFKKCNLSLY